MTIKVNKTVNQYQVPTSEDAMAAAMALRISTLRKARGFTFDELSKRADVSKGTLVQIEQGAANPSISTLCRLAATLGASVADLVAPTDEAKSAVNLVMADEARQLWTGPKGGSAVLLAGTKGPDMLEMWEWQLKSGERFDAVSHGRGTREIIYVTSGKLLLEVKEERTIIAAGVTAIALTDRPHSYSNPGKSPVRFIMTVDEPAASS